MQNLTTEYVKKDHPNAFKLVIHCIELAQEMMQSGRACRVQTSIQNPAYQALLEVAEHKDTFSE